MALAGRGARAGGFADLRARTLSAVVMVLGAAAAITAGGSWFAGLVMLASGFMMAEWRGIAKSRPLGQGAWFYVLAVAGAALWAETVSPPVALAWLAATAAAAGVVDAVRGRTAGWSVFGAAYIGLAAIVLIALRADGDIGLAAVAFLTLIVVASDAGAYFAGRTLGGPKLWPAVSPNKTWAGAGGGLALSAIVGASFSAIAQPAFDAALIAVAVLLSLASQAGDLGESAYKRAFGAKDSGRIIPGHGGVLDRLDGLIAASLAVAFITLARGGAPILQW